MPTHGKTLRQHLLTGTLPQGKPDKPSSFVGGRPKAPAHLSPAARQEFKRCVELLVKRGTVTPGDVATLAVYAEVFARWIQAKQQIGDQLMIETEAADSHGQVRIVQRLNPLLKIVQNCERQLLTIAKNLGLTPKDRESVKPTRQNGDDDIIPGSLGDTNPELFGGKPKVVTQIYVPVAPEQESEESDGNDGEESAS
jgi:P27 family predicted phage terminase small subunit